MLPFFEKIYLFDRTWSQVNFLSSVSFSFTLSFHNSAYSYRFQVSKTPIPLRNSKVAVNLKCSSLAISLVHHAIRECSFSLYSGLSGLYKQHHKELFLASSYFPTERPIAILYAEIIFLNALYSNFSKDNSFNLRVSPFWNSNKLYCWAGSFSTQI